MSYYNNMKKINFYPLQMTELLQSQEDGHAVYGDAT